MKKIYLVILPASENILYIIFSYSFKRTFHKCKGSHLLGYLVDFGHIISHMAYVWLHAVLESHIIDEPMTKIRTRKRNAISTDSLSLDIVGGLLKT